ncbi:MAG: alpha/beta hydrolase [Pseudomonadota bacterium]|nr:alpha/beta hydrolase [Pseudomonadota bacterium]
MTHLARGAGTGWREVPGGFETGEGPPLVLLPGIRGDATEYVRLVPRLVGWTVRLVTLPDAGPRLVDIAAAVARDLPVGAWDVVGASFGGLVGWALPPERVRTLTTLGTLPHRTKRALRMRWAAAVLRRAPERLYREYYGPRARASLQEDGADDALLDSVYLPPRDVFADRLAAIAGWGLPEVAPGTRPTWIWGATDRFVTWTPADVRGEGLEPIVVPGGHRPHLSHPTEVARWLPSPR